MRKSIKKFLKPSKNEFLLALLLFFVFTISFSDPQAVEFEPDFELRYNSLSYMLEAGIYGPLPIYTKKTHCPFASSSDSSVNLPDYYPGESNNSTEQENNSSEKNYGRSASSGFLDMSDGCNNNTKFFYPLSIPLNLSIWYLISAGLSRIYKWRENA